MPVKKVALSLIAVFALLAAVPALAAESTRESYVEAVEPVCKANTEANEKILKGVKAKVRAGKLDAAAGQVARAAKALKRAWTELSKVPKPTADATRLTKWLQHIKTEVVLFETVARKLGNGERNPAQKLVLRLKANANQTNNLVLGFEFHYCKFQPSKFI
jgi:hypothetical protein